MTDAQIAFQTALKILRDSIDSGRMPSGVTLTEEAQELHERAVDYIERLLAPGTRHAERGASEERVLDRAIREVEPDQFVTPLDASLVVLPKLASVNAMLGRPLADHAVNFYEVVHRVHHYHRTGELKQVLKRSASDSVLAALLTAALHEGCLLGDQLRPKVELLLSILNAHSTPAVNDNCRGYGA